MSKSLIIVESPSKAKTINKYLGKNYVVEASVGHIKNLIKSKLGVDIENGYLPHYETIRGKGEIITKLKSLAKKSDKVYIATDPDREGEAIAWHIAKEIESNNTNISRVLFHEITSFGITEAMKNPLEIDENMVQSQQARRIMDRIVGYRVSPFIWKTVRYGLSAGRVQSVALRLICEKEEEIKKFQETEYWSIIGEFSTENNEKFYAKLYKIEEKELIVPEKKFLEEIELKNKTNLFDFIKNKETVTSLIDDIKAKDYIITKITKKEIKRNPPPPFITSSLQQEASRRLRYSAKKTMMVAQQLYEGVEIGSEGLTGLITYMRTDSTRLSPESVDSVRSYISNTYGENYLPPSARIFKKSKSAQDAHEAIRPTSIENLPSKVKEFLSKEQYQLYELIFNRFVACQMAQAVMDQTTVLIKGDKYLFKATGSIYKFRGFLQVYDDLSANLDSDSKKVEEDTELIDEKLPVSLMENQNLDLLNLNSHQHFTKPPSRYAESSLVKELESKGIGRPSTYALIISTLLDREYVEQKERRLFATELGLLVNQILVKYFDHLFNVEFTAKMEDELDTIASGEQTYKKVLDDFYLPFNEALLSVENKTDEIKGSLQEATSEVCEKCGRPMVIKFGRNGKFMACSGYPECKSSKPLDDSEKEPTNEICDKCGAEMVFKVSKYGRFLGCSKYPECKNTKPITLKIKCPKCKEGEVLERKTKTKRSFYGCNRYPDCDFASWDKPYDGICPSCNTNSLVEKYTQKKGKHIKCSNCKSEYNQELEPLTPEE
jgi:DNA topoisomerase I